jgi:hypothetical protein
MKTVDDIKYEIDFIEKELANKEFTYLSVDELQVWLKALNWTLEERLVW